MLEFHFPQASHEVGHVGVGDGGGEKPVVADWGGAEGALPGVTQAAQGMSSRAHVNGAWIRNLKLQNQFLNLKKP